jgi:hypothetical protein
VLEAVGLVRDVVDGDAEGARKVELEQPVVADHLERDPFARRSEAGPAEGSCSSRSSTASFFTMAEAEAADTPGPARRGHRGAPARRLGM